MNINRIIRSVYLIAYYIIGYFLPNKEIPIFGKVGYAYRRFICKRIFSFLGKGTNIQRHVYFGMNNKISLGNRSGIGCNFYLQDCNLTIEDDVMTGPNVTILGGGHIFDRIDVSIGSQGKLPKTDLTIGTGSWIGRNVTILGKEEKINISTVIIIASTVVILLCIVGVVIYKKSSK